MKVVITILFTLLYTAFAPFAVTGFAASQCYYGGCKTNDTFSKEKGEIRNSSNEACTHQYAVTAHVHHKQTSNTSGGNKQVLLSRLMLQQHNIGNVKFAYSNRLCSNTVVQTNCPLFIKNCLLLI